jgi:alpha-glucosidase
MSIRRRALDRLSVALALAALPVATAAAHKLMIDVHDEYRGTGYTRTYPNVMTQEGIRGDEEKTRTNERTLTILFSRYRAGAADNTICYFDNRVNELCSHAYRLAKAVCLYSPLQHPYGYDRPAPGGTLTEEPELEFFDAVPTVWDETRVLEGRIGESAVIARRSGGRWFIGAMQSGPARTRHIPLSFLEKGRAYSVSVYRDDPSMTTKTRVRIERLKTDASRALTIPVVERGGAAVILEPSLEESKP